MKSSSAKAKGRALQKWARDLMIRLSPSLTLDDVQSRSSGANGEDVMLSPAARQIYPVSIECKNRKSYAIYTDYGQAMANNPDPNKYLTVVCIKQNQHDPLVVLNAEKFFELLKGVSVDQNYHGH